MAGSMGRFTYQSDDGNAYVIRMDVSNATAVGNTAATGPSNKPGRMRPRYILARNTSTGRERKLVICDPTNALWVGGDESVTITQFGTTPSTDLPHDILGRVGEKRYG
jgi:hypothetical protein